MKVLNEASRLYTASWVRDIGLDLRPNDYKKYDGIKGKSNGMMELKMYKLHCFDVVYGNDLIVIVVREGMEALRPALQSLDMTRAFAYRDALKSS
ncbi:hypothetical protein PVK06_019815 [Gossypium arboreum]|uniref:Uncharacterized protein n=1 Tax=Gossypium arboreum TaxID=29729 RepID=A0ABR0PKZ7_GOSAR|nr:hypothetical protein PVK06_019815 [Gossypium arboreum]